MTYGYKHKGQNDWPDLPNVDWPPNLPGPSTEEIVAASYEVAGGEPRDIDHDRILRVVQRAAALPWLVGHSRMSGLEAGKAIGMSGALNRGGRYYAVATSPLGRTIAQAMGRRLREIVRERMEQAQ